jgi:hypothetical protein
MDVKARTQVSQALVAAFPKGAWHRREHQRYWTEILTVGPLELHFTVQEVDHHIGPKTRVAGSIRAELYGVRSTGQFGLAATNALLWRADGHLNRLNDIVSQGKRMFLGLAAGIMMAAELEGAKPPEAPPLPQDALDKALEDILYGKDSPA